MRVITNLNEQELTKAIGFLNDYFPGVAKMWEKHPLEFFGMDLMVADLTLDPNDCHEDILVKAVEDEVKHYLWPQFD